MADPEDIKALRREVARLQSKLDQNAEFLSEQSQALRVIGTMDLESALKNLGYGLAVELIKLAANYAHDSIALEEVRTVIMMADDKQAKT